MTEHLESLYALIRRGLNVQNVSTLVSRMDTEIATLRDRLEREERARDFWIEEYRRSLSND